MYAQLAEPVLFPYPFPPWSTTGWERWPESRRMAVSAGQVKVNTVHFPVCSAHVSYITRRWAGAGKRSRSPGYGDSVVVHWSSSKTEKTNIYRMRGANDVLKLKEFSVPECSFCWKTTKKASRQTVMWMWIGLIWPVMFLRRFLQIALSLSMQCTILCFEDFFPRFCVYCVNVAQMHCVLGMSDAS